ncbi:hypothetical protein [Hymenobacter properus]|uniref:Uncharacterized protein n=1 Tax=Hymenobacter properus TaxID=2791026 RepID=A0A931FKV4_9BACT|nr:hypothetical protein [Hymenobacter properus]MBF9142125.1 hypothetical protein [Hymenobacter properus]MBR7720932.1 hypothetical protein [Microvirga sp. SRT04]
MNIPMNKYFTRFFLLLVAVGSLASCRESSKIPAPAIESVPLIIPVINPQKSYFDYTTSRPSTNTIKASGASRPVFEFVVNPSEGYAEIQTVEVYKSIRRGTILGPRVKFRELTSFPATITIDSQEALRDLYYTSPIAPTPANPNPTAPVAALAPNDATINRILNGDAVVFTFEYVMKDGRRIILTPLSTSSGSVGAPTGTQVNAPYAAIAEFRI